MDGGLATQPILPTMMNCVRTEDVQKYQNLQNILYLRVKKKVLISLYE